MSTRLGAAMNLTDMSGATRIPLIGRRALLQDAAQRLGKGGPHLVHFEGVGGIGKTALLEAILDRSREENTRPAAHIASQIIDLYHVDVHAPEGGLLLVAEQEDARSVPAGEISGELSYH